MTSAIGASVSFDCRNKYFSNILFYAVIAVVPLASAGSVYAVDFSLK